jgi:CDP-paratose 2-epimerase
MCEQVSGNKMNYSYTEDNRIGDHIWWISDTTKFKTDYPEWSQQYNLHDILTEIYAALTERFVS